MAQVARDGSRKRPSDDFREYAWMTKEEAKEYFSTNYATEEMLAHSQDTRTILHWDKGIEIKQYLVLVSLRGGPLWPECQEPDVKPPCQEPDAKPPWQEPDAKLPCQEPMVFRFLI